ncbi:phosphohistidine phosphatase SixA [Shewanella inventionis]|uniref:Phosphohistidine phosphatase SixA n=1 Tax=Shewanella inventionis TaxID=1738770 RepID=A0ABQ1IQF4_9GAMM|nr:phosphohistidine phosphatase SixA [Shewanella inventionis]MCL1159969.1 phosphohistidine phosphatase SixA [Shewanella inventionis]UAL42447.1 phosphohistidine phosphatase SixA [Shewanella inventionis]GGB47400.1 phosphohistidine phosphatase SixA [Shewanella inventionis]
MQLFLMRHGESSFDAPSDRERKLTEIGRVHSGYMANWLVKNNSYFDLVIVSPYLRAQQTWQEVSKHLPEPRKFVVLDDVTPSGDAKRAVDVVLAYADQFKADKVLVIAHMPILGFMVSELVAGIEPPLFATSAIAQIDKHMEQCSFVAMTAPHQVVS